MPNKALQAIAATVQTVNGMTWKKAMKLGFVFSIKVIK